MPAVGVAVQVDARHVLLALSTDTQTELALSTDTQTELALTTDTQTLTVY